MAKLIEVNKFKVIECTAAELMDAYKTQFCVCDFCGTPALPSDKGYYIPVLNHWYCGKCFEDFKSDQTWHPEDKGFEDYQLEKAKRFFNLNS